MPIQLNPVVTITVTKTLKTLNYKGALLSYSFEVQIVSADGDNFSWPYRLTDAEVATALTGNNLQTIIERETVNATNEAYKFFQNPPYSTKDVIAVDTAIEGSILTVVNGVATLVKK